ncbi:MAG: NifB/NifX family molybdenum-iron cluster-binding protein [Thermodesulfobacteriota bacterium]|nr:NifB/NifX family molybdenum-iron cluster-binding protein [Thermodesulfobacteriota bacterium]
MKIAVTSTGTDLNADLDPRFGRTENFIIIDTDTMEFEVKPNSQNLNLPQGAGIQAGKTVADTGVEAVITGNCGPKAFTILEAAGIKVITGVTGNIKDAIEKLKAGELQSAGGPNVEGHWV